MQILHRDQPAGLGYLGRQFVQQISTQTGNPIVQPGELAFRFLPVLAPLAPASQFFVQAAQLLQEMAQRSLVLVPPAIRERRQSQQAHINPNGRLRVCLRHPIRYFDGDGDKPPVCRFTDACREDFARQAELFRHIHPAQFGNLDPVIADGEFIVGQVKRLPGTFLAFELGIAYRPSTFAPLKKVMESSGYIHERALNRTLAHLIGPGKLLASDGIELFFESHRIWLAPCLILRPPPCQCPIEHKARRAGSAGKVIGLFRCWMKPDFVRFDHP